MKKLFLAIALLGVLFTSCKKETITTQKTTTELNGVWFEGEWDVMDISGVDTTWTHDYYVGDGYNNGVTTVNVTGSSYNLNDIVNVDGDQYVITDLSDDTSDPNWRYYLQLEISNPYSGCKYYLEIYKRQDD